MFVGHRPHGFHTQDPSVTTPVFYSYFYIDYGYNIVGVSPLVGDKLKQIITKCHQIATSWQYLFFGHNLLKLQLNELLNII